MVERRRTHVTIIPTHRQKLALVLKRMGQRDHEIAAVLGYRGQRSREKVCRLRRRGLAVLKQLVEASNGAVTIEQVLDGWAQKISIPTPSLELAIAS